jgi:hypothetical protein
MSRMRRFLRLALILVVASPLILWLAANMFINVGLEPLINGKPEKVRVRTSFAWMWWPGDVDVRGLEIRGQGKNDQWLITVDHATATIDLKALMDRELRASNVKGKGGTFRYRFRATEPVDPATDATPPIIGLTNPPDPVPDGKKGKKGPFKITLVGAEVEDVRELWVEDYHYVGSAHAKGDVTLADEISVGGQLDMQSGQMLRGANDAMIDSLEGQIGGKLGGIVRGEPITREVLAGFDAKVDLKAKAHDLSFVNYYLQSAPWLKLDGAAELDVDVTVENGEYVLGSVINAHTTDMLVDFFAYEIAGDGTLRMEVVSGDDGPETHMGVNYSAFTIHELAEAPPPAVPVPADGAAAPAPAPVDAKGPTPVDAATAAVPLVVGEGFKLTAVSPDTLMGKPLMNMNVLVEIPESSIPDVKRFDRYMPNGIGLGIQGGSGGLSGHFAASTSEGTLSGMVDLTGDDVVVMFDQLLITTDLLLHAQLAGGDIGTGVYDFSGTYVKLTSLGVHDMSPDKARDAEDIPRTWWSTVTVTKGDLTVGAPVYLDSRLTLFCANSEPFIKVVAQQKKLPGWVQNALHVPDVKGSANIKLGTDTLAVNPFNVEGGQLEVKARLFRRGTANTGAMYARYGKLTVAVDIDPGDTNVHVFDAKDWYAGENADKAEAKDAKEDAKDVKELAKDDKKAEKADRKQARLDEKQAKRDDIEE